MKNKLNMERSSKNFRSPLTCSELLQEFRKNKISLIGKKLQFSGVGGKDVYNISKPFTIGGKTIIAGRVEARTACADSQVVFFEKKKDDVWYPVYDTPILPLEDGFAVRIGDETIVGGVNVCRGAATIFYRGRSLSSLKEFTVGPEGMKDIRFKFLPNRHIGVFTRPLINGKGKIGYIELQRLEDITAKNLLRARIIENQFALGEWGGVNDLELRNGLIRVYGHIAYEDELEAKHYYMMRFIYNPKKHQAGPIKILATRDNFPPGEAKTEKHKDIVFLGGLVHHSNNTVTIYAGTSDAEAHNLVGNLILN